MEIIKTKIKDCLIIEPKVFGDNRGFFLESYQSKNYKKIGIELPFVQDNFSRSAKNILRGLHSQVEKPQGKLVSVVRGSVFDVAVDLRGDSETYGLYVSVLLSDENHKQFYIPPGCAHGFVVLSEEADFHYKCTDFYDPNDELGIIWNDKDLNINWPINSPILSEKDKNQISFKEYEKVIKGMKND